jgi:ubiquinone/menaquinone biosynthesis C-methylase UbiE
MISDTYKALADESRLRLLHILSKGQFNVQELTSILGSGQSTVSHHLKILSAAGLLSAQKQGTWVYYSLNLNSPASLAQQSAALFLERLKEPSAEQEMFLQDVESTNELLSKRRDQARNFFESVANKWHDMRDEAQGSEPFFDLVASRIPKHATLLDLGCGSGAFFEHVLPRPGKSIGVDYSQGMLTEAKQRLGAKAAEVDFRLGYLEHLPIGDESVDYMVCYMVLHHVAVPPDAIHDAFRVLKPGGKFIVVDLMRHQNERMRERYADLWLGFDPEEVKDWAFSEGFAESKLEVLGQKKDVFIVTLTKHEDAL